MAAPSARLRVVCVCMCVHVCIVCVVCVCVCVYYVHVCARLEAFNEAGLQTVAPFGCSRNLVLLD